MLNMVVPRARTKGLWNVAESRSPGNVDCHERTSHCLVVLLPQNQSPRQDCRLAIWNPKVEYSRWSYWCLIDGRYHYGTVETLYKLTFQVDALVKADSFCNRKLEGLDPQVVAAQTPRKSFGCDHELCKLRESCWIHNGKALRLVDHRAFMTSMELCEWWSGADLDPFRIMFRVFQPEYGYRFCKHDRSRKDTSVSNLMRDSVTCFQIFLESLTDIALKL